MDLLGSILGSMEKPPTVGAAERKKIKAQKELVEKQQEREKNKLQSFREQIQKRIHEFIKDGTRQKLSMEPMEKTQRAIAHEVAELASLTSFSFGIEEQDRYVMLWKKEFAPSDEEILAYRKGEEWDPEKAKQLKEAEERLAAENQSEQRKAPPTSNYQDKYRHLIGDTAAKAAAQSTYSGDRSYGLVSSANKRDQRTIEQVLADTRAKKKQKVDHDLAVPQTGSQADGSQTVSQPDSNCSQTVPQADCSQTASQANGGENSVGELATVSQSDHP